MSLPADFLSKTRKGAGMNVILTTRCAKNCSFCFARQTLREKGDKDMSIADFEQLLEMALHDGPNPVIKLLGGEPTMHPQFDLIIDILTRKHVGATLISNLLYTDPELRERINRAAHSGTLCSCLANAAELDRETDWRIFQTNFTALQESFAASGNCARTIHASITLSRHKSAVEETDYLAYLAQNLKISLLRLSLDFQGENRKDEFFINNKEYGQKILAVIYKCLDLRIPISWDCKIYPCLFEPEVFQKDVEGFVKTLRTVCDDNSAPFDVFPDLSYVHCFPCRSLVGQNILQFYKISEAKLQIAFLKRAWRAQQSGQWPEPCQSCHYYQNGQCDSLCLGCREVKNAFL
jgi:hypothetical protein